MADTREHVQIVLTTAGSDDQAEQLARGLVERHLAACVNVVGGTCSVYRWEGKVRREEEKLLVVKTAPHLFEAVCEAIRELHTYDVPEILALPVDRGDHAYVEWIKESLASEPDA